MKASDIRKSDKGFTLTELMIVVAIIGILTAIAVPVLASYRAKAYDVVAKNDLRNAMEFLGLYFIENGYCPVSADEALEVGCRLSEDVSFTRYSRGFSDDGVPTIHMHVKHALSTNEWHGTYSEGGSQMWVRLGIN